MAVFFSYPQLSTITYISRIFSSLHNPPSPFNLPNSFSPMRNFFSYTFPFRLDIPTLYEDLRIIKKILFFSCSFGKFLYICSVYLKMLRL